MYNNNKSEMQPPPDKKRKTEPALVGEETDDWGDDVDDCQLENIDIDDIVASQQVTTTASPYSCQTNAHTSHLSANDSSLIKPVASSSSSKVIGKGTAKSRSTSDVTSSYNNSRFASKAPSTGPLSSIKNSSTSNWQSGSAAHSRSSMVSACGDAPQTVGNKNLSSGIQSAKSNQQQSTQSTMQQELAKLKRELVAREGQNSILQSNLSQRDAELKRVRQEKAASLEQSTRESSERERTMEREIDRLRTQLTFKDREISEMEQHSKNTEKLLRDSQSASPSRSNHRVVSVSPARAKCATPGSTATSPKGSGFPTTQSFMADSVSPKRVKQCLDKDNQIAAVKPSKDLQGPSGLKQSRMKLALSNSRGQVSAPQLVIKLMRAQLGPLDAATHPQTIPRTPPGRDTSQGAETVCTSTSGSEGVRSQELSPDTSPPRSGASHPSTADTTDTSTTVLHRTITSLLQTDSSANMAALLRTRTQDCVSLVTVISKCIARYIAADWFNSNIDTSLSTAPTLSTSDGSPDMSLTSSAVQESAIARTADDHMLEALRVLECLALHSAGVRSALLAELQHSTGRQSVTAEESLGEPRAGCSKSVDSSASRESNQLLTNLCSLANRNHAQLRPSSLKIAELSLDILAVTFESASSVQLERVSVLPLTPALLSCVTTSDLSAVRFDLLCRVLRVTQSLVRAENFMDQLCSQSDDCLLDYVCQLCSQPMDDLPTSSQTLLQEKLLQLFSSVLSSHRVGSHILMNSSRDCQCNEVAKYLSQVLYQSPGVSPQGPASDRDLDLLRQGAGLLQALSLADRDAAPGSHVLLQEVEPQYVRVVSCIQEMYAATADTGVSSAEKSMWEEEEDEDSQGRQSPDNPPRIDTPQQRSQSRSSGSQQGSLSRSQRGSRSSRDSPMEVINID